MFLIATICVTACGRQSTVAGSATSAAWQEEARKVTISRDTWGIPHVYGKTDADAVFGVIYAQAEDDFNRVETNYLNALGRLAEAEGEGEVFRDLRMKLFIDPDDLRAQYDKSPDWLKALMNAWVAMTPAPPSPTKTYRAAVGRANASRETATAATRKVVVMTTFDPMRSAAVEIKIVPTMAPMLNTSRNESADPKEYPASRMSCGSQVFRQ